MAAAQDPPRRDELDQVLRSSPLLPRLGFDLVAWGPGWARVSATAGPDLANLAGSVHGGVLLALADAAFEAACNSYGRICVAVDTAAHYASPAPPGETLVAHAIEAARSRRTASYRIEVHGHDGALRAWCMALCYRTERWHLGAEGWPSEWRQAH